MMPLQVSVQPQLPLVSAMHFGMPQVPPPDDIAMSPIDVVPKSAKPPPLIPPSIVGVPPLPPSGLAVVPMLCGKPQFITQPLYALPQTAPCVNVVVALPF